MIGVGIFEQQRDPTISVGLTNVGGVSHNDKSVHVPVDVAAQFHCAGRCNARC